jgi:hypothetical protein
MTYTVEVPKSGHKGVTWSKSSKRWRARVRGNDGKQVHLGYFESKTKAATTRNLWMRAYLDNNANALAALRLPTICNVKTSEHADISWDQSKRRWHVQIYRDGKLGFLGYFKKKAEAFAAHNAVRQTRGAYDDRARDSVRTVKRP